MDRLLALPHRGQPRQDRSAMAPPEQAKGTRF
ncbi:hypothetical protein MT3449.2 [Mycobacterium tuberculosis CDC1551]|uniref:Uncharacterized protein n=1 Tax=Mycobacterium tuberculosis (strain CDC 1551 / Oshkosh) TaxID=83331 RepID=Q8VJ21_MYCTO|nr:hypothetical protein MT3449.2 [Mycobacterium tuberculosis CDC1551]